MSDTSAVLTPCAKCGGDCSSFAQYVDGKPYHRHCNPWFQEGFDAGIHYTQLESQIDELARVLLIEFDGPKYSESACEMAVRLLREDKIAIRRVLNELGVPGEGYPAPVANAVEILTQLLEGRGVDFKW